MTNEMENLIAKDTDFNEIVKNFTRTTDGDTFTLVLMNGREVPKFVAQVRDMCVNDPSSYHGLRVCLEVKKEHVVELWQKYVAWYTEAKNASIARYNEAKNANM